jgi:hypothetical protein
MKKKLYDTNCIHICARPIWGILPRSPVPVPAPVPVRPSPVLCVNKRPGGSQSDPCLNLLVPRYDPLTRKLQKAAASKCVRDLPDGQYYQQEKKKGVEKYILTAVPVV